jgi:hypothetical protein
MDLAVLTCCQCAMHAYINKGRERVQAFSDMLPCTALPKAEFFIEPPPNTQRRRRRGERGIGVARGSYLLLTSLSPLPLFPPPHRAPAALPGAPLSGHFMDADISGTPTFQGRRHFMGANILM